MDEQERTDDLVRSWMSLPVSQRDADGGNAAGPGSVARPNGLYSSTMLVREIRKETREVDWIASTEAVDSYDTVIKQDWDGEHRGLDRFRANPVILFAHNSRALPIGRATKVGVEKSGTPDAQLVATVKFATAKANPMAEYCWQSVLEEVLRGMSVGWLPGGYERIEIEGVLRTVFIRNSLYELSVCPVPSNPEALNRIAQRAFGDRVWSFGAPAPQQRSASPTAPAPPQPQSPAIVAAPKQEKKAMSLRSLIIEKPALDALVRTHVADVKDGDETIRVSIPGIVELDMQKRMAEERATKAETRITELTSELTAANKRMADAEKARDIAKEEQLKAEKLRDAAVAERAKVELEPLTGADAWQMSPATRDDVAALAATDPDKYKRFVQETRAKGVTAGALARELPSGHLPTRAGDPTPRGGSPAGDDVVDMAMRSVAGARQPSADAS